jgi:tetratricopeptide (TPR) repeat protein
MNYRHFLPTNSLFYFVSQKLTWVVLLFGCLLLPQTAKADDITQQLQRPLINPAIVPNRNQADSWLRTGEQQYASGFYEKSITSGLQALRIYRSLGDLKAQGKTYDLLAGAYLQIGDLKNAEDFLRRRIGIARDNQDFLTQIFALNNLGTLLLQKGEIKAAEITITDALAVARNIEDLEGQGLSLSNLGLVANRLGDYYRAVKLSETALIFRRQTKNVIGEINTLNNLGDAYLAIGDYDNTIGAYGVALRLAKLHLHRPTQLRAIDGLVTAHSSVGRYDRALELLEQRSAITKFLNNPREELIYFFRAAELYEKMGRIAKAKDFYRQAIALAD